MNLDLEEVVDLEINRTFMLSVVLLPQQIFFNKIASVSIAFRVFLVTRHAYVSANRSEK